MIGDDKMQLKKFKKLNYRNNLIIVIFILLIIVLASVYLYKTYAIFTSNKQFNVINGTVGDPGDIYFAYYVDGKITRSMPTQNTGYTLNEEKSECTNGVVAKWDNASWQFIGNYSNYNATDYTRTRCNLYFEKTSKIVSTSIGDIEVNTYTPDFSKSACDDDTCESHEKGIYETLDDDGTSYYYRGSVENNYVKFAGFYWRIICINGNGSIRVIYDGTVAHDNGESSEDRNCGYVIFNGMTNDNMYVGYMYESGLSHGLSTSSALKSSNDNFYSQYLLSYSSFLDINAGFWGDRSSYNVLAGVGTGSVLTYYKSYTRLNRATPSLKCYDSRDYYTVNDAVAGNKKLTYPIGLVNLDEIVFAGSGAGYYDRADFSTPKNKNGHLISGTDFWTMSPSGYFNLYGFSDISAVIFSVGKDGYPTDTYPTSGQGLRPVINLKNTLKFTGDGTKNNPYVPSL